MKKLFVWFIKFVVMLVLLAATAFVCLCIYISQTWFIVSGPSLGEILLDTVLFSAIFVLYIFLCKKIVCFDPEDYFEDYTEYFKDNYK
ncbi:MAG: hypothetical protein NC395_10970 [Prevotella sp.]|nr:hypothetical protein [Prevotella sp.]